MNSAMKIYMTAINNENICDAKTFMITFTPRPFLHFDIFVLIRTFKMVGANAANMVHNSFLAF